ncbi:unnamed protein product, partial [Didymodactylos carnosus]
IYAEIGIEFFTINCILYISYETKMKDGTWNWNKFSDDHEAVSALKVADIDGQLVTLDGRRLLVIQKLR